MKNDTQKPVLIVIVGPTASGKTSASIALGKIFDAEIISADSRQIFREMQVGTARPLISQQGGIPHHLLASNSVDEDVNAGKYAEKALQILEDIFQKKQTAILVGGTGLYINAVCDGIDDLPQDDQVRDQIYRELEIKGLDSLTEELKSKDPVSAHKIDLKNFVRVARVLEVCRISGQRYSDLTGKQKMERPFEVIKIGMKLDREELYNRINERVDSMMLEGLLEEVRSLLPFRKTNALQTVGYKEIFQYLDGEVSLEEAVALIKQHTRNYAKRQLTWFKKDAAIVWFDPNDISGMERHIKLACKKVGNF